MTQHDLERVLEQQVSEAHLSDEAVRSIRRAVYKEEKPVKRKMRMGLVLALAIVMISATALAASGSIMELIDRLKGSPTEVLPGGTEMFGQEIINRADGYVDYAIVGHAYDGRAAGVVIEITPRVEDTLILHRGCVALKCWERGQKPCVPPIQPVPEGEMEDPVLRYARENGYRQVVLVDAIPSPFDGGSGYVEWQDNKITILFFTAKKGEAISGDFLLESAAYTGDVLETPQCYEMVVPFELIAPEFLWETKVNLDSPISVPEYGLSIDWFSLTGTKLGVYADVHCRLNNSPAGTEMTAVDEGGEFLGYGLLEITPRAVLADAEAHIFTASLPAMEDMPEEIHIKISEPYSDTQPVFVTLKVK